MSRSATPAGAERRYASPLAPLQYTPVLVAQPEYIDARDAAAKARRTPHTVTITLELPTASAAATLAAIEDVREKVGTNLEAPTLFATEDSWTFAAIGLGALAAGIRRAGIVEDADYVR
jgi:hypothetical protein